MEFASQLIAIFGVLGLMLGLLYWSRNKGWASFALPAMRASSAPRQLQSLERLPLTAQHSLHLVRVGDKTLLVGVSPSGIALLDFENAADRAAKGELGEPPAFPKRKTAEI